MDDRTRKLGIAGLAAALFVGFIFLTRWTGDDPGSVASLGDQERDDLQQFCFVFSSSFVPYELLLRVASGQAVSPDESGELGILDSGMAQALAQNQINLLVDRVPEEYGGDARDVADGLRRALDGSLEPDEVDDYVAVFERLQERAAGDCEAIDDVVRDEQEQSPDPDPPFGSG